MTMRQSDGTVRQSGLVQNPNDYDHERISYPVVGVVMNVRWSDDPFNVTAVPMPDQRGFAHVADVLVVSHGNDNPWLLPNVVITPSGASGVDDYEEQLPRPCTQMIDGSKFDQSGVVDWTKVDGDWCVVEFIGGSIEHPVMMRWWPHPGNRQDPATLGWPVQDPQSGPQDANTLKQGRRYFKRFRGLKCTVTAQGSLWVDTNESNASFSGSSSGVQRKAVDDGGDIQVDVKKTRSLEFNWNPPVALPKDQPSLPQQNPPQGENTRATDRTTVRLDKDTIHMLAGKICEILTSDDYIDFHAKTKVRMRGDDGNDSVLLGAIDPGDCDHSVKGETFRDFFNGFIDWAVAHTHGTAVGPTSDPIQPFTDRMSNTHLSPAVMVKK